jgi:acylphosphatase
VRNAPDGSVELEAEGEREAVERLLRWCRTGPPSARVEDLDVDDIDVSGGTGFDIRG